MTKFRYLKLAELSQSEYKDTQDSSAKVETIMQDL